MATPPTFTAGAVLEAGQLNKIGMWLVSETSATTGATLAVNNVFSADYDSYMVVIDNYSTSSGTEVLYMRLGSTTTGYYTQFFGANWAATTMDVNGGSNVAQWDTRFVSNSTTQGASGVIFVHRPFNTTRTSVQFLPGDTRTGGGVRYAGGFLDNATSYTGFTVYPNANNFATINVKVYGLRES